MAQGTNPMSVLDHHATALFLTTASLKRTVIMQTEKTKEKRLRASSGLFDIHTAAQTTLNPKTIEGAGLSILLLRMHLLPNISKLSLPSAPLPGLVTHQEEANLKSN